ncbi:F0F1 ATP synthase subunit gamma [Nitrosophilus alvini]|uniref:F0F1 ATP synthase subunit gamma n=1 Tax=Nitrosophilus alvini TaxID=2714855 RepID=UPI00190CA930|nr:FoF1 ATP synthase subunit gamma [Nitrosophilus alvini]
MITSDLLQKKLESLKDIYEIVNSMKAFAKFAIQKSKDKLPYVRNYKKNIEESIEDIISLFPELITLKGGHSRKKIYIVFGSEEGLCGGYNEKLFRFFSKIAHGDYKTAIVGRKAAEEVDSFGIETQWIVSGASTVESIETKVADLALLLSEAYEKDEFGSLYLIYYKLTEKGDSQIEVKKVLPPDFSAFRRKKIKTEPLLYLQKEEILHSLVEEYILISLYGAFLERISSENQERFLRMQTASKNIEKKRIRLYNELNMLRQEEITAELMEIINGYRVIIKGTS